MKNVEIRANRAGALPAKVSKRKSLDSDSASARSGNANPVEDIRDAVTRLKRERIIATAVDLFHYHGLGNTTLEAVAEKMNVTKPFIY